MMISLKRVYNFVNQRSGVLLAVGLAAVAFYNWRQWQKDRRRLEAMHPPAPLPPLTDWPALPMISVLVAAWNEEAFIQRHIESFLALRYPHKELILCAGGEDATYEIALRYAGPQVRVLRQAPGEGKQRALARAFPYSQGEIIFFTDADGEFTDDAFERTLWPAIAEDEFVVTGSSQPLPQQLSDPFVFTQVASQIYNHYWLPSDYGSGILGANCAVKKQLLATTHALEKPAPTGTDYVLAKTLLAAGERIRLAPTSRMPTHFPENFRDYLRQQRRWLRNVAIYGRRFGAMDEVWASVRTSLLAVAMLFMPWVGLLMAPWMVSVWIILMVQAWLARVRYLVFGSKILGRSVQIKDIVWQPLLMIIDFLAWASPLLDYFSPRQRWRW